VEEPWLQSSGGGVGKMAETEPNLILRLLREIRDDTQDTRHRITKVERRLDELHEGMVSAMGLAGLASVATEKHGEGMDEIRDEITALKRRVQELESRA
jgi:polyhydroxyalkanoate synthesis regulator phasin